MSFVTNFTVGPAKLYHGVEDFLCKIIKDGYGEISHRSPQFTQISKEAVESFRSFFQVPDDYRIYYTYSSTEGLELISRSVVDEKICHVSNGNFGTMWSKISKKVLKKVQLFQSETHGERVRLEDIVPDEGTELLAITANETAAGIAYSPEEIKILRNKYPEILFAIDATSGFGGVHYNISDADLWSFSVQKAFGMPAGLGILLVSERAYQKSLKRESEGKEVGAHHSFSALEKKMDTKFQTPTTPNFLNIATFGYFCDRLKTDFGTIENLYKNTQEKAKVLYDFFDQHPVFSCRVEEKNARSETVIIVKADETVLKEKFSELENNGIFLGKGYGAHKTTEYRIGNFPVHSLSDIENLLSQF